MSQTINYSLLILTLVCDIDKTMLNRQQKAQLVSMALLFYSYTPTPEYQACESFRYTEGLLSLWT